MNIGYMILVLESAISAVLARYIGNSIGLYRVRA